MFYCFDFGPLLAQTRTLINSLIKLAKINYPKNLHCFKCNMA